MAEEWKLPLVFAEWLKKDCVWLNTLVDRIVPGFPAADKRADPRYRWYVGRYGARCWELDALSPVAGTFQSESLTEELRKQVTRASRAFERRRQ